MEKHSWSISEPKKSHEISARIHLMQIKLLKLIFEKKKIRVNCHQAPIDQTQMHRQKSMCLLPRCKCQSSFWLCNETKCFNTYFWFWNETKNLNTVFLSDFVIKTKILKVYLTFRAFLWFCLFFCLLLGWPME